MARVQNLGGTEGIGVNYDELRTISNALNTEWVDEYIPIPGISLTEQIERIMDAEHEKSCTLRDATYWKNMDDGRHGWACPYCGRVHQWG